MLAIKKLHQQGVSWERLESFGLEQKWCAKILRQEVDQEEGFEKLLSEEFAYARRQLTWWRKREAVWVKNFKEAQKEINKFLFPSP